MTKIEAFIQMHQCAESGQSSWQAKVNGQLVSGATESKYFCLCAEYGGSCMTKAHTSVDYPEGFPGYVYGGNNAFSISMLAGTICVADVDLRITYGQGKTVTVTADTPMIPTGSSLASGCVQYRSAITGKVTEKGKAVPKYALRFKSDRNGTSKPDVMTQPSQATDSNGSATGRLETRKQGTAKVSDDNDDATTPSPLAIKFAEAYWQSQFQLTAYIVASEADYTGAMVKNPCGLSGNYRKNFLFNTGVLMQGSGKDLKGNVITIDWAKSKQPLNEKNVCFRIVSCPLTASNVCAEAGKTIAVDRKVVPMLAQVDIGSTGQRTAQDTGNAIKGYHIDVFRGFGKSSLKGWGNYSGKVRYLSGGGECDK